MTDREPTAAELEAAVEAEIAEQDEAFNEAFGSMTTHSRSLDDMPCVVVVDFGEKFNNGEPRLLPEGYTPRVYVRFKNTNEEIEGLAVGMASRNLSAAKANRDRLWLALVDWNVLKVGHECTLHTLASILKTAGFLVKRRNGRPIAQND